MRNIDILPNEDLRMDEQSVLTQRELEDLHLLAAGFENNEMAKIFCVTTSTIKIQLKNIYKKLHAKNRANAVFIGLITGLISIDRFNKIIQSNRLKEFLTKNKIK